LPDAVVCYADTTITLPILTAYALDSHKPRPMRRLYDRRSEMMDLLKRDIAAQGRLGAKAGKQF